jgi:septal ring factor EnvC (AmiA/AmiB activator)
MKEFSAEEIKEVVRTAQIYAHHFTEEQYQKLMGMHRAMAQPGFIESASGVLRLVQEYGIPCSQAPAKYVQIVKDIKRLEKEAAEFKKRRESEVRKLAETSESLDRLKAERSRQERELAAFRVQAGEEKKRLEEELEKARERAGVREQDIANTVKLKALVASHGLDLEFALRLGEEFACDSDAATQLAQAVSEGRTQLEAREAWQKENDSLKAESEERRTECDQLKLECQQHREVLSRLQADLANEDRLRRFHQRYQGHVKILEHLDARWEEIVPIRCQGPFCNARFWVSRAPSNLRAYHVCPCCGLGALEYDVDAIVDIGLSSKGTIEIKLGGDKHG